MGVGPEQLPGLLTRSLAPVYLLAGAEPLLIQECRDLVLSAAQQQGFSERTVFDVNARFDWDLLNEGAAELSLFSSRKIVDVRLPTGKPGLSGSKALTEMADAQNPDVLLLVSCGQWDASSRKSKWAAKLARIGVLVEIWAIKPHQLPQWIRKRMVTAGLEPEPDAIALLAELVEGNLLAAQQEIDKLLMQGLEGRVTAADIHRAVADSARFDAFRLVECVLLGRLDECLRVASGLQRIGVAIQPVSGALHRELTIADAVRAAVKSGENESSVFSRLRVWHARQSPIHQAVQRLSDYDFEESFRALTQIDLQSKGRMPGDPWQTLDRLLWKMCDPSAAAVI